MPSYEYLVHQWLRWHFGSAKRCENRDKQILKFKCSNQSKHFEWANTKKHKYKRKRNDFIMLCISCHRKYDMTEKTRKNIGKGRMKVAFKKRSLQNALHNLSRSRGLKTNSQTQKIWQKKEQLKKAISWQVSGLKMVGIKQLKNN